MITRKMQFFAAMSALCLTGSAQVLRTPEADNVLRNLIEMPRAGRYAYSVCHPWPEDLAAFRKAGTNGTWTAKEPDEFSLVGGVCSRVGVAPLLYFSDFYFVTGTWRSPKDYAASRASLTAMIRKAWKEHGSVPVLGWHPENPYVPAGWRDSKHGAAGYRYRYSSAGYPQEHHYVLREIMEKSGGECGFGRRDGTRAERTFRNPYEWYDWQLTEIAEFLTGLHDEDGRMIPVIVRLLHEVDGDWSWWGAGSASARDYIVFCRHTVARLRQLTGGGAHLLFAYSPDRHWSELGEPERGGRFTFLSKYPGDDVVDIVGLDDYTIGSSTNDVECAGMLSKSISRMRIVSSFAASRGKAAGLFETGPGRSPRSDAYDWLHRAMTAEGVSFGFANTWGGHYTIPGTAEGKSSWRRFVSRDAVITSANGGKGLAFAYAWSASANAPTTR